MAWNQGQVRVFARDFARRYAQRLAYLSSEARLAFLDKEVMRVVLGQERESVRVEDVRQLREDMINAIESKELGHGYFED